jgi:shikimate kinase
MNIILFGFKGSGKTHFGQLLAIALKRPFIDTDNLMVELYAQESGQRLSIRAIHQLLGEKSFRALESQAITTLSEIANSVIALGGGALMNPKNVAFLQTIGQLVYLEASFETVQKRIFDRGKPSFIEADDSIESLRKIYHDRKSVYESIAASRIDTDLFDQAGVLAALRSIATMEEPPYGL